MNIPNLDSNSQNWIDWHKYLLKSFGRKDANEIFMQHWQNIGQNSDANDSSLRAYMSSQGVNISGEYGVFSWATDAGTSASQGFGKVSSSFSIGIIIIVLMLVGATYFLFLKKD